MKTRKTFVILSMLIGVLTIKTSVYAQEQYSTYWYQRASLFENLKITSRDIVFVGNSITDGAEWYELLDNSRIKNRGISGDVSNGVYDRLDPIVSGKPKKIFLMIGINDLSRGKAIEEIADNIEKIVTKIQAETPKTKIYLQSVLPVSTEKNKFAGHTKRAADIIPLNNLIQEIAKNKLVTYIDLYSHFVNSETKMIDMKYTNDGLHLLGSGYMLWSEIIKPYL